MMSEENYKGDVIWLRYGFLDEKYLGLKIEGFGYKDWSPDDADDDEVLALIKKEFHALAMKVSELVQK